MEKIDFKYFNGHKIRYENKKFYIYDSYHGKYTEIVNEFMILELNSVLKKRGLLKWQTILNQI